MGARLGRCVPAAGTAGDGGGRGKNSTRYNRSILYRKYCGVRARGPRAAIADTMCGLGNTTRRVRCAWAVVEIASPKARVLTLTL